MMRTALRNLIIVVTTLFCAVSIAADGPQDDLTVSVQQEAKSGKYLLIDTDALWELYQDTSRNILLIDTRQEWEYLTGHITDAIHFSMEPTWFSRLIQRHTLAQELGPDKDRILVFY